MSLPRNSRGLTDAQPFAWEMDDYARKGAYFQSLTGVAITRLANGDWFYAVDPTGGNVTVTLPAVGDEVGHHHIVKRITGGSNACNIVADDASAILDGSATHSIAAQYDLRCYISDGAAWRGTNPRFAPWATYAPGTPTAVTGTLTSASATGRQLRVGNTVFFHLDITITTNGTGGTAVASTLPYSAQSTSIFAGREDAVGGKMLQAKATGGATLAVFNYDNSYPGADGAVLRITGCYEAT